MKVKKMLDTGLSRTERKSAAEPFQRPNAFFECCFEEMKAASEVADDDGDLANEKTGEMNAT